jgi:hypothetical protein
LEISGQKLLEVRQCCEWKSETRGLSEDLVGGAVKAVADKFGSCVRRLRETRILKNLPAGPTVATEDLEKSRAPKYSSWEACSSLPFLKGGQLGNSSHARYSNYLILELSQSGPRTSNISF